MPDFEKMYFKMAAKMADAIETLGKVSRDLKVAQIEGEEMFIGDKASEAIPPTENVDT